MEDVAYSQPRSFIAHDDHNDHLIIGCGCSVEYVSASECATRRGPLLNLFAHVDHSATPDIDCCTRGVRFFPNVHDAYLFYSRSCVAVVSRGELVRGGSVCSSRVVALPRPILDCALMADTSLAVNHADETVVYSLRISHGALSIVETNLIMQLEVCRRFPVVASAMVCGGGECACYVLKLPPDNRPLLHTTAIHRGQWHRQSFNLLAALKTKQRKMVRDFVPEFMHVVECEQGGRSVVYIAGTVLNDDRGCRCGVMLQFALSPQGGLVFVTSYYFDTCAEQPSPLTTFVIPNRRGLHIFARGDTVWGCALCPNGDCDRMQTGGEERAVPVHRVSMVPRGEWSRALPLVALAGETVTALCSGKENKLLVGCSSGRVCEMDVGVLVEEAEASSHAEFQPIAKHHSESMPTCDWLHFDDHQRLIAVSNHIKKLMLHTMDPAYKHRYSCMPLDIYENPFVTKRLNVFHTRFGYVLHREGEPVVYRARDFHELSHEEYKHYHLYDSPQEISKVKSVYPLGKDILIQFEDSSLCICVVEELWVTESGHERFVPLGTDRALQHRLKKATRLRRAGGYTYLAVLYSKGRVTWMRLGREGEKGGRQEVITHHAPHTDAVDIHLNAHGIYTAVTEDGLISRCRMEDRDWKNDKGGVECSVSVWAEERGVERTPISLHPYVDGRLFLAAHANAKGCSHVELWDVDGGSRVACVQLAKGWRHPGEYLLAVRLEKTRCELAFHPRERRKGEKMGHFVRVFLPLFLVTSITRPLGRLADMGDSAALVSLSSRSFHIALPGYGELRGDTVAWPRQTSGHARQVRLADSAHDAVVEAFHIYALARDKLACTRIEKTNAGGLSCTDSFFLSLPEMGRLLHTETMLAEKCIVVTHNHILVIDRDRIDMSLPLPSGLRLSSIRFPGMTSVDVEGRAWRYSHSKWETVKAVGKATGVETLATMEAGRLVVDAAVCEAGGRIVIVSGQDGRVKGHIQHHTAPIHVVRGFCRSELVMAVDGGCPVAVIHRRIIPEAGRQVESYTYNVWMRIALGCPLDSTFHILAHVTDDCVPPFIRAITPEGGCYEKRMCECQEKKWREAAKEWKKDNVNITLDRNSCSVQ